MAECIATHTANQTLQNTNLTTANKPPASLHPKPALIGASWGAMLALAYAAAHPTSTGPIVLIGCGTFTLESRAEFKRILAERLNSPTQLNDTHAPTLQSRIDALAQSHPDPDARLAAKAQIISLAYQGSPTDPDTDTLHVDAAGNRETWDDMLRLQANGTYPAAFAQITSPVLMLHGGHDPHPGAMIRDSLLPYLPRLEYHEIHNCGHDPWREPLHRAEFYSILDAWLARHQRPSN